MNERAETLGQRLQAAREKKGLSAQKAADELHLDGWVIEGLESGNYGRIGPPVYAKGHLKRYAELLGLPVADVLADFDGTPVELPPPAQPAGIRMRTSAPVGSDLPWAWIVGCAVVVLIVAGVLWWRPWHPKTPATAASSTDAATPVSPASSAAMGGQAPGAASLPGGSSAGPAPSTGPAGAAGSGMAAGSAGGGAAPVGAAAGTAAAGAAGSGGTGSVAVADPKAASGRARLRLSFLADSWVDVHDANGQRLFAGTGHVNNVRSMSGEAPFRVYLKSASSIRMEINGHGVAIGPQFVVANVAHFAAGADGVLRRDPRAVPTK